MGLRFLWNIPFGMYALRMGFQGEGTLILDMPFGILVGGSQVFFEAWRNRGQDHSQQRRRSTGSMERIKMKSNIRLSLFSLTAVRLLALLRNVIAKLTGNTFFPAPPVTLAELTAKGDELEVAIEQATGGSKASKATRNALVLEVREMLRSVADYVRSVAKGSMAMLATSGFELARQPEPIGVPGIAKDMQARVTNSKGHLDLRWRAVHGARGYQVWMTTSDPSVEANWEAIGYTTRSGHLVSDLESYKAHWFCVSAIGSAGEGLQCDPAMGRAA